MQSTPPNRSRSSVMGNCVSAPAEEREAKLRSSMIDKELRSAARDYGNTIKILLLGAGESGKSTVVKQMKIIHGDGYNQSELETFKPVIYGNLLTSMRVVVQNMEKLEIPFANPENKEKSEVVLNMSANLSTLDTVLPAEVVEAFHSLWADDGVKQCFTRAYEYQLNDSAPYFFSQMDMILSANYTPTQDDVLRSRVQTTGIIETTFRVGKLTYRVVDVGGQRSERRKWIQCFDDVRAVLFVCALSGYDMSLFEDNKTNRLDESLNLFQAICNNKFFTKTSMILFLNKIDLFSDKITNTDRHLRLFMKDYSGPDHNVEAAAQFIQKEFLTRNMNNGKIVYPHFTTATDTSNIKVVFKVVLDTIIRENLEAANLL